MSMQNRYVHVCDCLCSMCNTYMICICTWYVYSCTMLHVFMPIYEYAPCMRMSLLLRVRTGMWMYVRLHKYMRMCTQGWGHVDLCIWHHVTCIGQRWQILSPARHDRHGGTRSAFAWWVSGMAERLGIDIRFIRDKPIHVTVQSDQSGNVQPFGSKGTRPPPGKVRYIPTKGVQELSSGDHHRRLLFKTFSCFKGYHLSI